MVYTELVFGEHRLKLRERELVGPTGRVDLSARAFDLLCALLAEPDALLDKDALFAAAWPGMIVEDNTLQVHISALRKAIGADYITTVHGRGYKYVGPPPNTQEVGIAVPVEAAGKGNIARYRSECIERAAEAGALSRLLEQHRLISIVGPGGVGKTTLATAVAADLEAPGGVWLVDLASLDSGAFIGSALIQVLGIPYRSDLEALHLIADHLRRAPAVLLFDTCEHVQAEAAEIIGKLLFEVPGLQVLTTSQFPLGVAGERVFKLLPFSLADAPTRGLTASGKFLRHCIEMTGDTLSPQDYPVANRLCYRLGGVALALKMAAARAATSGLEAVDAQIERQLAGLQANWNAALPRHQSLLASIRWSYDLLPDDTRASLRALGVFSGSFSLAGVVAVAGDAAEAHLAELVRRSLVVRDAANTGRYRLLDSMRRFALLELNAAQEEYSARDRHAAFVTRLFALSIEQWETTPDLIWEATFRPDGDNLRAALAWTRTRPDSARYVKLVAETARFYLQEQLGAEGLSTIESAVPKAKHASVAAQARLGLALGEVARVNAADSRGRQRIERALIWLRDNDRGLRYFEALVLLTWTTTFSRDRGEVVPLVEELRDVLHLMPVSKTKAWALVALGMHMWLRGDKEAGLVRARAGSTMHIQTGNPRGRFRSLLYFAEMVYREGDMKLALELARSVLPDVLQDAARLHLSNQLGNIAAYLFWVGEIEEAEKVHLEALPLMWHEGSYWHLSVLQNAAECQTWRGDHVNAVLLLGIIDKRVEAWPDGRQAAEMIQRDRLGERLAEALGRAEYDRLLEQSAELDLEDARSLAAL